jgi:hypothetical protein
MDIRKIFQDTLSYYLIVVGVIDIIIGVYPYIVPYLLITGVVSLIAGPSVKLTSRFITRPLYLGALLTNLILYLYLGTSYIYMISLIPQIAIFSAIFYLLSISSILFFISNLS